MCVCDVKTRPPFLFSEASVVTQFFQSIPVLN
jgi:hypothetical protein